MAKRAPRKPTCEIRALSITQPFAELILRRRKPIEIRSWRSAYRGSILIHASQKFRATEARAYGIEKDSVSLGAFVGVARVDDIRPFTRKDAADLKKKRAGSGEWSPNQFAWVLRAVKRIEPIPFRGKLNLFTPPATILRQVTPCIAPVKPKAGSRK